MSIIESRSVLRPTGIASAIGKAFGDDNPQALAQFLANTPLTRFMSSVDKIADPRKSIAQKALILGTGVRVTDLAKQEALATRAAVEELMKCHANLRQYSSYYVRPEDTAKLTPEELELMRAYSTMQNRTRQYAKEKKLGVRTP